jgi:hypothetical protein
MAMSGRDDDDIPTPEILDRNERERIKAEEAESVAQYFAMLSEQEMKEHPSTEPQKVVPIRPEIAGPGSGHTDTELIPETPADWLMQRLCFDPEESLVQAESETWLLDDLIPSHGIGFIYGPPGSYKSFIALDMAASVSSGREWHGYQCETPGAVVYIAAEGQRGIKERSVAWKRHYERDLGPMAILEVPVMMDDVIMVQAFTEVLERAAEMLKAPIRMVVIDTMARSFTGDENSAQEIGAFVNACSRFSNDIGNCFVLVVAHTGKDLSRGMRGSSALDGAADCHFLVTKPNPLQALVKNTKQKDVEMAEPMRFAMESVSTGIKDRKGRIRKSLVPILESQGEDADPDSSTKEVEAFDAVDMKAMAGMVKAAEVAGKKITEDDLRKEFIEYMKSNGKGNDAARKAWQRTYQRVRDQGLVMKAGANLYVSEKK